MSVELKIAPASTPAEFARSDLGRWEEDGAAASRGVANLARPLRWWAILPIALLLGCVSLKPETRPHSTVLFSVTLGTDSLLDRQPTGLIVNVEAQRGSTDKQFAFTPNDHSAGPYTTFLVRLDLPPGPYRLSRLSATSADGVAIPQYDVEPSVTFDVRAKTTDYIGHVELSNPRLVGSFAPHASRMVIVDAYEQELPNFVHVWPALRGRAIGRRPLPALSALSDRPTGQARQQAAAPGATPGAAAAGLDLSSAAGLPPDAQQAFRYFLRSGFPRAFAVTASGYYTGMAAGGTDVIGRALQDCKHAQPREPKVRCRLFALDDTLLSSLRRSESMPSIPMAGR